MKSLLFTTTLLIIGMVINHGSCSLPSPLPSISNCSLAFGEVSGKGAEEIPAVYHFSPLSNDSMHPVALRALDAGFGTTGTKSVQLYFQRRYPGGSICHHRRCSGPFRESALVYFYRVVLKEHCVVLKDKSDNCRSKRWLESARKLLLEVITQQRVALTDSPYGYFVREFVDLVPEVQIIHSVRDPFQWVLRRVAAHGAGDLLCDPRIVPPKTVSTPFSILECLSVSEYASDYLITMADYLGLSPEEAESFCKIPREQAEAKMSPDLRQRIQDVIDYYIEFNWSILMTARPQSNYQVVCVWDEDILVDGTPMKASLKFHSR